MQWTVECRLVNNEPKTIDDASIVNQAMLTSHFPLGGAHSFYYDGSTWTIDDGEDVGIGFSYVTDTYGIECVQSDEYNPITDESINTNKYNTIIVQGRKPQMKLEWDKTGERYLEYGTKNGVLYVQKADGTYDEGVVWNGLTAVTESPDGAEPNDLYADDMKYASLRSAETFGGTIEAFQSPDEFDVCDGTATPVPGFHIGQQKRSAFGFCYVTQVGNDTGTDTDDGYKLHLWYNCTASPSERSYETVNDSPDAITFSWEITTTPVPLAGYKPVSTITIDSTKLDTAGKAALTALEEQLYGRNAVAADANATPPVAAVAEITPNLPSPAEVLAMFNGSNS